MNIKILVPAIQWPILANKIDSVFSNMQPNWYCTLFIMDVWNSFFFKFQFGFGSFLKKTQIWFGMSLAQFCLKKKYGLV